jgi:hypothetical protein
MLKELTKEELQFLAGGERNNILGVTMSKITLNYPKTLERHDYMYPHDTEKMLSSVFGFSLELYALSGISISNKGPCKHLTFEITMSKAEYREFCDNYDNYIHLDFKEQKGYIERRYPGLKNVFVLDTLRGYEKLYDIEYLFSNEVFKHILNKKADYRYIFIPFSASVKDSVSFSKPCIKGILVLEVDNTFSFETIYRHLHESEEVESSDYENLMHFKDRTRWYETNNPVAACHETGPSFESSKFLSD